MQYAWFEYRIAFRNVTRQYRRSLFGIFAVNFGVVALTLAAVIIVLSISNTMKTNVQERTGEILVTGPLALNAFLLAVGTTLLASVYPAWKASRMEIVDALRHTR